MDVAMLIGDHPRHRHIARTVAEAGYLERLIIERREEHVPEPPDDLDDQLSHLYSRHFARRAEAEKRFFGDPDLPDCDHLEVDEKSLNSPQTLSFLDDMEPDLLISYGVHKLSDSLLNRFAGVAWNIHGGLSPEYRGVITHFWPSYLLEPQMTGMTLHELTPSLDAGPIVHQTSAPMVRGDGLHDLACRAVATFSEELPRVIRRLETNELRSPEPQRRTGKLWLSTDWRPDHLRLIYDVYDDQIVDRYLDGVIRGREPDLVRQFGRNTPNDIL
jgi:folate-dependent phosphoribosylglycinamide formyltransferase PurN